MIFDLWDTLVDWPRDETEAQSRALAKQLGVEHGRFVEVWRAGRLARETGPLRASFESVLASLELEDIDVLELVEARRQQTRDLLRPRPGVVETLLELRRRGHPLGLLSACSEDVADVWRHTELRDLFDSTVFSCSVGVSKPDPRIYAIACAELRVPPARALFVGDGANDELAGAERAGLKAVLILRPGQSEPQWPEAQGWQPRITAIPQILELLGSATL